MKKEISAIQNSILCTKEDARQAYLALKKLYLDELAENGKVTIFGMVKLKTKTIPARAYKVNGNTIEKGDRTSVKAYALKASKETLDTE